MHFSTYLQGLIAGYVRGLDPSVATIGAGVSAFNNTPIVFGPVANNDCPTVTHVAIFDL